MARAIAATLGLGLLGLLATTSHAAPPTPLTCGAAPTRPARSITTVDWCTLDGVAWKGSLVDGRSSVHLYRDLGKPHDTISTRIVSVDYADLDGDRRPEAFVVIERATWIAPPPDVLPRLVLLSDVSLYVEGSIAAIWYA